MRTKEVVLHRIRDIDAALLTNKKLELIKFIFLRNTYKLLKINTHNLHKKIPESYSRVNGLKFYNRSKTLDFLFHSKFYEPETKKFVLKNKNKNTFLDIGSHIGVYAVPATKFFKKSIAIEANPKNFDSLQKNIKLNNCQNISPIKIAASDKKSTTKMIYNSDNTGATRIDPSGDIEVKTETLDNILKENKTNPKDIDIVLIDIEGHENTALKGANNFLNETKAKLIIECFDLNKIKKILSKYNYKVTKNLDFYNYLFEK